MVEGKSSRKKLGSWGEKLACRWLSKNGYKILERNFSSALGEIDIIAQDENYICFIEVKTRSFNNFGTPFESINHFKKKKLQKLALSFLRARGLNPSTQNIRFDVVGIDLQAGRPKIEVIKGAF